MIPIVTGSTKLVTDKVRAIGHLASLIVVGGMLGGMVVYTAYTAKRRVKKAQGSCWYKWGPTVLVGFATCFIIADTVRHVLQDQGVWPEKSCRGFVGCGGSNQYQCADSTSHSCCPPGTYDTIYKGCTYDADAGTKCPTTIGPKVDISWALACDAGKGKNVLDDFLNEKWAGGTAGNETLTNKQELQKLGFNSSIDAYFYHHLQGGCHSNEKFSCLGGMGTLFTAVFTYFGFSLLLWGSLWNANLVEKLGKAKSQWDQLRGNTPIDASQKMASPLDSSDARGSVAAVDSDAEFKRLVSSGAQMIVQFSASWCSPCKQIAPVFAELSAQYGAASGISFLKLDVDECEAAAEGVSSMPTFKFYSGGKEVDLMTGADQAKLSRFVQKCAAGGAGSTAAAAAPAGDVEASVEAECTT